VKVYYDKEADAAYLELSDEKPVGVVEVTEGVNVDVTAENRIVGIELLDASKRIPLSSLLTYELDKDLLDLQKAS
jgi:uncharacterized protein YuzE